MPKKGYNTVTINEKILLDLKSLFAKHEMELRRKGVNTISGFTQLLIYKGYEVWKDEEHD